MGLQLLVEVVELGDLKFMVRLMSLTKKDD